jgi:hypothetical protein
MYLQTRGIFLYTSVNKEMRKKRDKYMKHHKIEKILDSAGTDEGEHQQSTLRRHSGETKHIRILQQSKY